MTKQTLFKDNLENPEVFNLVLQKPEYLMDDLITVLDHRNIYILDEEEITFRYFLQINYENLSAHELTALLQLKPGSENGVTFGGGAAGTRKFWRLA